MTFLAYVGLSLLAIALVACAVGYQERRWRDR